MEPNATVVCNEVYTECLYYTEYLYYTFNFIVSKLFNCQIVLLHFCLLPFVKV